MCVQWYCVLESSETLWTTMKREELDFFPWTEMWPLLEARGENFTLIILLNPTWTRYVDVCVCVCLCLRVWKVDRTENRSALTRMGDWKAVGGFKVVNIVVEVERLLSGVLVGVVELDGESEGAVLLHRGTHEQSPLKRCRTGFRQFPCTFCASVRYYCYYFVKKNKKINRNSALKFLTTTGRKFLFEE